MPNRRERLVAPPSWWIGAAVFALAWAWVALVVSGTAAAVVTFAGCLLVVGGALWSYGSLVVAAGPEGLSVGPAHLPLAHVGAVRVLDAAGTRALLGPQADARAWLRVRPYVRTAVQVEVDDPADPTPYWLVSTRDPSAVAAALGRAGQDAGPAPADPPPARPTPDQR